MHSRVHLLCRAIELIQRDPSLPVFGGLARKLTELCSQECVSMDQIAGVVELDTGLTAQYLRLANSAYFLSTQKISTVKDALIRIGLDEVRKFASFVSILGLCQPFQKGRGGMTWDWKEFWLHNLLTARLMPLVVDCYRDPSGREYLAGLLHDVGKLLLGYYFPVEYGKVMESSENPSMDAYRLEKEFFDTDHAEIGWVICEHWSLDSEITQAIRFHHRPGALCRSFQDKESWIFLVRCLALANALAKHSMNPEPGLLSGEIREWEHLKSFPMRKDWNVHLSEEADRARIMLDYVNID